MPIPEQSLEIEERLTAEEIIYEDFLMQPILIDQFEGITM